MGEEAIGDLELGAVDGTVKLQGSLPWRKLVPIFIILWCEAFNSSSIFAYIGWMVLDFGMSKNEQDPTYMYYVGILGSSFFMAQFISSFFWGFLSDKIGRRPVLLFGSTGALISSLAFGFSFHYIFAVVARSINGLLNGTIGITKTYMGEICDSSNIAKAFGWTGLMWGFGVICGSVFGGLFARPAVQYPSVFSPTGLFGKFPYLIPNLTAAVVTGVAIVLCYFFLTENPKRPHPPSVKDLELKKELELEESKKEETKAANLDNVDSFTDEVEMKMLTPSGEEMEEDRKPKETHVVLEEGETMEVFGNETSKQIPWYKRVWPFIRFAFISFKSQPIFKESVPVICCLCYAIYGALQTMADEIWPLWAREQPPTGLRFSPKDVGYANAWGGVSQLAFNAFLYPIVVKKLGLNTSFKVGVFGTMMVYPLFPMLTYLPLPTGKWTTYIPLWLSLGLLFTIRVCFSQMGFAGVMTMISNSVYPENMGAVNGLGQSLVALTRSVAPFTSATILAVALSPSIPWPLNYGRAAWYTISLVAAGTLLLSWKLPTSVSIPRLEWDSQQYRALAKMDIDIYTTEEVETTDSSLETSFGSNINSSSSSQNLNLSSGSSSTSSDGERVEN